MKYSAIAYVSIHCGASGKYESVRDATKALQACPAPPTGIFSVADTRVIAVWQFSTEGTNPTKLLASIPNKVREKLEQAFGGPAFTAVLDETLSIPMFIDLLLAQEGGDGTPS